MTNIHKSIPKCKNVNKLMTAFDEQFKSSDKSLVNILIKFSWMKLTGTKGVLELIIIKINNFWCDKVNIHYIDVIPTRWTQDKYLMCTLL